MDLKLISVSCLNSCGRHSFDLSFTFFYGTSWVQKGGGGGGEGVCYSYLFFHQARIYVDS